MYGGKVEFAKYKLITNPNEGYLDEKDAIRKGDLGNYIEIKSTVNDKEIITRYAHLNQMDVSKGQIVQVGEVLGLTGKTGNASAPDIIAHLHIEIEENINGAWIKVDPEKYLTSKFDAAGNRDPNTGNCKQ